MRVNIGKVAETVGVTVDTIRRWEKEGKIKSERSSAGHRRYDLDQVLAYVNNEKNKPKEKIAFSYARSLKISVRD